MRNAPFRRLSRLSYLPVQGEPTAQGPYNEIVMDHFTNPRNMGELEAPSATAEAENPMCGDVMRLHLEIRDGRIVDARFKTFGCTAAVAASSITTVLLKEKSKEEALLIANETVGEALGGLPRAKQHCSVLAEEVIRAAIEDYGNKRP